MLEIEEVRAEIVSALTFAFRELDIADLVYVFQHTDGSLGAELYSEDGQEVIANYEVDIRVKEIQ